MASSSRSGTVSGSSGPARVVRATDLTTTSWPNGRGTTREIHREPGWRLSLATVDAVGTFSVLPDVRRYLLLASDTRLDLAIDGVVTTLGFTDTVEFDGSAAVEVVGLSGTSNPLNLMTFDGMRGRLTVRWLDGAATLSGRDAAVVVLAGRLHVGDLVLGPHDTLLLASEDVGAVGEAATLACVQLGG
jgi:environmental stress-induced protein Ves